MEFLKKLFITIVKWETAQFTQTTSDRAFAGDFSVEKIHGTRESFYML